MELIKKRGRHKNGVSDEVLKTSVITINDVLEELSNENKRLLNELMFANKCLKSLITFKTFVDFISNKFKHYLDSNECQKFEKLRKDIENNLRTRLCEQRLGNYGTEEVVISESGRLLSEDIEYKPQLENRINSEEIPNNPSIIDSNSVTNLFKESLKTNVSKILSKISENVKYNQKSDYSDNNSDDGRHSDGFENNYSDDFNPVSTQITTHMNSDHKSTQSLSSRLKQQNKLNSTQIDSKNITKLIKCQIKGCQQMISERLSKQHFISVHKDSELNCSVDGCNQTFESYDEFTNHLTTHPLNESQTENTGDIELFFRTELRDGHQTYVCNFKDCGKEFAEYRGVYRHNINIHNQIQVVLKCQIEGCDYECHSKYDFVNHKKTIHGIDSEEVLYESSQSKDMSPKKLQNNEPKIMCEWPGCEYLSKSKFAMTLHFSKDHLKGRKRKHFICNECGVVSMGLDSHKQHISCHKDYYNHKCKWKGCDYKCKKTNQMTDHIQKHTRTEPLVCEICNKAFLIWRNLVNHKKIHTDNAFICGFEGCGQTFQNKQTLFRHRILMHQKINKQFKCSHESCSLTFKNIYHLRRHQISHRKSIKPNVLPSSDYKSIKTSEMRTKKVVDKPEDHNLTETDNDSVDGRHSDCFEDSNDSDYIPPKTPSNVWEDDHKSSNRSDSPPKQQNDSNLTQNDLKVMKKKLTTKINLVTHKNLINGQKDKKIMSCDFEGCAKLFKKKAYLSKHRKTHLTVDKPFKCDYEGCSKSFSASCKLKNHQVYHREPTIPCEWPGCEHWSKTKKDMRRHLLSHESSGRRKRKDYVCEYKDCGVVSIGLVAHKEHISCHKDYYPHKCDWVGCQYQCKKVHQMTDHIQKHTRTEPLICEICNKEFLVKSYLLNHKKMVHRSVDQMLSCDFEGCGKTFKNKTNLFRHRIVVHQRVNKPFKCNYEGCSLSFRDKQYLKNHQRNHGEPTIPCVWPGCEYKAKLMATMRSHEWVHKPEVRRFVCEWPECGKTVRHRNSFKDHMRSHYNDKRHVCEWPGCGFRTVTGQSLTKHRRTHRT